MTPEQIDIVIDVVHAAIATERYRIENSYVGERLEYSLKELSDGLAIFDALIERSRWRPIAELAGEKRTVLVAASDSLTHCRNYDPNAGKRQQTGFRPTHFCELPTGAPNEQRG